MEQWQLKQIQSQPLEYKIRKTVSVIKDFYERYEGKVYLSKSGFDSEVVYDIIQRYVNLDIKLVSISAAEPKGVNKLNAEHGAEFLRPVHRKKDIVIKYGYPLVSKQQAMALSRYVRTKFEDQRQYRLYGRVVDGKKQSAGTISNKYHELRFAPFFFTEKCCVFTKEAPLVKYSEITGTYPITGERAVESNKRLTEYLKHGCIMDTKNNIKCTPVGFWTDQDMKAYAVMHNMVIPEEYGEIVEVEGELEFTGEQRTGCAMCGFGINYDPERFKRMKETKPLVYQTMMNGGEWKHTDIFREVKMIPGSEPIMSDLAWVPNEKGYGYRFVLEYLNETLGWEIEL